MTKPTDHDLETYPHVILTSDMDWDPSILDNEIDLDVIEQYLEELPPDNVYGDIRFDCMGNYRGIYTGFHNLFLNATPSLDPNESQDFEDYVESCL